MTHTTIKSSVEKINNRFDLILLAARLARKIQTNEKNTIMKNDHDNKCTVLALKEIEKKFIYK